MMLISSNTYLVVSVIKLQRHITFKMTLYYIVSLLYCLNLKILNNKSKLHKVLSHIVFVLLQLVYVMSTAIVSNFCVVLLFVQTFSLQDGFSEVKSLKTLSWMFCLKIKRKQCREYMKIYRYNFRTFDIIV